MRTGSSSSSRCRPRWRRSARGRAGPARRFIRQESEEEDGYDIVVSLSRDVCVSGDQVVIPLCSLESSSMLFVSGAPSQSPRSTPLEVESFPCCASWADNRQRTAGYRVRLVVHPDELPARVDRRACPRCLDWTRNHLYCLAQPRPQCRRESLPSHPDDDERGFPLPYLRLQPWHLCI